MRLLPCPRIDEPIGRTKIEADRSAHLFERRIREGEIKIGQWFVLRTEKAALHIGELLFFSRDLERQVHKGRRQTQEHNSQQNFFVVFLEEIHKQSYREAVGPPAGRGVPAPGVEASFTTWMSMVTLSCFSSMTVCKALGC